MSKLLQTEEWQPQTARKIRCESSNGLKEPELYDMTGTLEALLEIEAESAPGMRPRVMHRECYTATPSYHPMTRQTGFVRIAYCVEGSALLIDEIGTTTLLTSGSVVVLPSEGNLDLLLGRARQVWLTAYWEPNSPCIGELNLNELKRFTVQSLGTGLQELTSSVAELKEDIRYRPNLVFGWINWLLDEAYDSDQSFRLAPAATVEIDTLSELINGIQAAPQENWNLATAARFVGYSPFHLSRIFRSTFGVGLPKYVELCRTELAVARLVKGGESIGKIAQDCGFGSSQAMRTAVRDHTGFLPVELRGQGGE